MSITSVKKRTHYEVDMTNGNFFKKIVLFCLPLMFTGILQLLYNAADLIVVGQFSDEPDALGAVGSTSALINLIINLFMGLSVGSNVQEVLLLKMPINYQKLYIHQLPLVSFVVLF